MRAKYKPLVAYVGDRHELMNVINEMIGELNASHTGASAGGGRPGARAAGAPTRHLGIDLEPDDALGPLQGRPRLRGRPARQGLVQGREGELPDRHRRQARQEHRRRHRLPRPPAQPQGRADPERQARGRRLVEGQVRADRRRPPSPTSATSAGSRSGGPRWTSSRKGRVGYLHIKAMDQPSLARFKKDLAEFRHKEALVIDQRWNGGGNIEQELLAILVQRPTRSGSPAGPSRPRGRSTATSARRSSCRTGGAPRTPRCSPPASAPSAWAR